MKITIKKQSEETIDITFPHYTKSICSAYCFQSETECVEVKIGSGIGIEMHLTFPIEWLGEDEVISKEEFETIFNESLEKIKTLNK